MLGIALLILLLISIYRASTHIRYAVLWKKNIKIYEEALSEVYHKIVSNKEHVNKLGNLLNPISGLGVEDIWLTRIGDIKVKDNKSLTNILEDHEVKSVFDFVLRKHNSIKESVLKYHFSISLLQGWHKESRLDKIYQPLSTEIYMLNRALKSVVKSNFKKLAETESFESIHYEYAVVFYRKYTYNLYKMATAVGILVSFFILILFIFPIIISIFNQRKPYYDTLEKYVEDLNDSDSTSPILLSNFESGKVNDQKQNSQYVMMRRNSRYHNGKIGRTIMWIILFSGFGLFCTILGYVMLIESDFDGSFLLLFIIGLILLLLLIDKIILIIKLVRLIPKRR
jgi:hypothetical protein